MRFIIPWIIGITIAIAAAVFTSPSGSGNHESIEHNEQTEGSWLDDGDTGRCNGDCANCPPHYGYRYGRWYYGHSHQHGCQRGGNGGASGRTYRD